MQHSASEELTPSPTWKFGNGFSGFTYSKAHRLASSLNRLMYSPCYLAFYIFIIFACIGMLAWTLVTKHIGPAYIAVDVILNLIILLEIIIRIIALSPVRFFGSWLNIIDGLVVVACIVTTILEIVEANSSNGKEVIMAISGSAFIALRCVVQGLRVAVLLRMHIQRRRLNIINLDEPGDDDLFGDLSDEAVFAPEGDKDDGVAYVAFDDHLMS